MAGPDDGMVMCARPGCGKRFRPKVHNQRYHELSCRRLVVNVQRPVVRFTADAMERLGRVAIEAVRDEVLQMQRERKAS